MKKTFDPSTLPGHVLAEVTQLLTSRLSDEAVERALCAALHESASFLVQHGSTPALLAHALVQQRSSKP